MKKLFFVLTVILSVFSLAHSQNFTPCLTDELYRQSVIKNPGLFKIEDDANKAVREQMASLYNYKTTTIIYIPIVFHIVHQNGVENISQAQIMDEIRILNEDYRKVAGTNGGTSTDPLAADMQIEFRLAQYDPNGNKSDGITRNLDARTVNADDGVKSVSYWDSNRYLNIWVVSSINNSVAGQTGTVLGYAQFPYQRSTQPLTDGVVVRSDQIGMIGSGQQSQAGRTLTHEIGHWLGLYHPFQGGCVGGLSSNCASQGDQVCDTPPVAAASFGCLPATQNSCTNDVPDLNDKVKDYMDYGDGNCMNLFTAGQKVRVYGMSFTGPAYRGTASSSSNLVSTGIGPTGNYLPVSAASRKAPYSYDFENASVVSDGWVINNFNNPSNGWQLKSGVAQSGNNCISMANFSNAMALLNSRDGFQSPEIDLTTLATPYLNFYYAYTQKSGSTNDILNLTVSDSFGMAETKIFSRVGGDVTNGNLATSGVQSTEFVPNASQWRLVSIDLTPYKYYNNARFRFEFLNRRGNDIYIDNFSITNGPAANGIDAAIELSYKFNLYPNPMNDNAVISFELKQSEKVKISIFDMVGRQVMVAEDAYLESGSHKLNISKSSLRSGVYFIRFESGESSFNHKLLIN